MGLFYTGKGDKGKSSIGKKKIPKDHPAFEVLGDLDELNSLLGVIRSTAKQKVLGRKIEGAQQNLFIIQANVAWFLYSKFKAPRLSQEKIYVMEREIDAIEKNIRPERGFIVSGQESVAAWLDYARAVARRAERSMFSFAKKRKVPPEILTYLNRLSSYLYALARLEIRSSKTKEFHPTYQ